MRRTILICFLLVFATLTVYWPVGHAGFLNFDDTQYVTNNPKVFHGVTRDGLVWAFTTFHACNWHPLTWLSHMLDCQVFGENAAGHHWVNVFLHAANAVLLFLLLLRMTGSSPRSGFVAALFALHPLHVESVAWIAERKDVLSTFFGLLALVAYVHFARVKAKMVFGIRHSPCTLYLLALFMFALSLMSKPMLVTLPFLLLLLDYWPLQRLELKPENSKLKTLRLLLVEKIPFLLLAIASAAITFHAQRSGGAVAKMEVFPIEVRVGNACLSCVWYVRKAFWPVGLGPYYSYPTELPLWPIVGAGAALVVVTFVVLWLVRRAPYFFTGWFWHLGALVPVIGLVQVGSQMMADRYTYIPLVGVCIAVVWGGAELLAGWRYRRAVFVGTGAAILGGCMIATGIQVRYWKNSITLFDRALAVSPENNALAQHNLGHALSMGGNQREAIVHFREAIRWRPDFAVAHLNWGNSVAMQGNVLEAMTHYRDAIRYRPDYEEAYYDLACAFALQDKFEEAEINFRAALRCKPDYAEALLKLGNLFALTGKSDEALANQLAAVQARPDYEEAHYYLAGTLARQKKFGGSIKHLQTALELKPDYAAALNDLAWIRATQNDPAFREVPEAIRLAARACALTQDTNAKYLDTLSVAYSEAGRFKEAIIAAEKGKAVAESMRDAGMASVLQQRIETYRAGKSYRQGLLANGSSHR